MMKEVLVKCYEGNFLIKTKGNLGKEKAERIICSYLTQRDRRIVTGLSNFNYYTESHISFVDKKEKGCVILDKEGNKMGEIEPSYF